MTTSHLAADISRDEGLELKAYPDPLSPLAKAMRQGVLRLHGLSGEPWTCGYGCTGPDVREGTEWTEAEAAEHRDAKIAEALAMCHARLPWFSHLNDARQDVVVNMVFNMGWSRFAGFHHMIVALSRGDFNEAAFEMLDSLWAEQVRTRAARLAQQMRTGVRL